MSLSYTNGTTVTTGNDWCSAIGTEPYTDSSPNDYYGCRVVLAFHTKGGWVKSGTRSYSLKENHYSSSGSASESNVKIENNTYHIKIEDNALVFLDNLLQEVLEFFVELFCRNI